MTVVSCCRYKEESEYVKFDFSISPKDGCAMEYVNVKYSTQYNQYSYALGDGDVDSCLRTDGCKGISHITFCPRTLDMSGSNAENKITATPSFLPSNYESTAPSKVMSVTTAPSNNDNFFVLSATVDNIPTVSKVSTMPTLEPSSSPSSNPSSVSIDTSIIKLE